jgi:hypothetical protein
LEYAGVKHFTIEKGLRDVIIDVRRMRGLRGGLAKPAEGLIVLEIIKVIERGILQNVLRRQALAWPEQQWNEPKQYF